MRSIFQVIFFFSAVTNEHVKLGWWVKNAHTELCSYSNASIVIAFFSKTILVHGVLFFFKLKRKKFRLKFKTKPIIAPRIIVSLR